MGSGFFVWRWTATKCICCDYLIEKESLYLPTDDGPIHIPCAWIFDPAVNRN